MSSELVKGQNTPIAPVTDAAGLVIGVRWSGSLDCDVVAVLCGDDQRVRSDDDFLFWDNQVAQSRAVFLRQQHTYVDDRDRGQVLVDLPALPAETTRIVVALATVVSSATLDQITEVQVRCWDPVAGQDLLSFSVPEEPRPETCLVLGEVYRRNDQWKFRAIGQGYASGLRGLGIDYGVNVE